MIYMCERDQDSAHGHARQAYNSGNKTLEQTVLHVTRGTMERWRVSPREFDRVDNTVDDAICIVIRGSPYGKLSNVPMIEGNIVTLIFWRRARVETTEV